MAPSAHIAAFDADRAAVIRMARGDESAIGELYDRHARAVYSLAVRMLADAATPRTSCRTSSRRPGGRRAATTPSRAPVVGWLLVMARARTLDRLRARRSRLAPVGVRNVSDRSRRSWPRSGTAGDQPRGGGRGCAARSSELPEGQRQADRARRTTKDCRRATLPRSCEQPLGTVKTRMRTALLKLREALREAGRVERRDNDEPRRTSRALRRLRARRAERADRRAFEAHLATCAECAGGSARVRGGRVRAGAGRPAGRSTGGAARARAQRGDGWPSARRCARTAVVDTPLGTVRDAVGRCGASRRSRSASTPCRCNSGFRCSKRNCGSPRREPPRSTGSSSVTAWRRIVRCRFARFSPRPISVASILRGRRRRPARSAAPSGAQRRAW